MLQSRNGLVDGPDTRGRFTRLMAWSAGGPRRGKAGLDARAILESLDGAVIVRGLDGIISTWNSAAERLYGYAADEAVGRPYDLIVPDVCRDGENDAVRALLAANLSDCYETQRLCKDGTATAIWVQISAIADAAGTILGISTIEDELTAKQVRSTPAVETYLRSAFEDAPIGIALISVDPESEGRFLRVNPALCRLTGYTSGSFS